MPGTISTEEKDPCNFSLEVDEKQAVLSLYNPHPDIEQIRFFVGANALRIDNDLTPSLEILFKSKGREDEVVQRADKYRTDLEEAVGNLCSKEDPGKGKFSIAFNSSINKSKPIFYAVGEYLGLRVFADFINSSEWNDTSKYMNITSPLKPAYYMLYQHYPGIRLPPLDDFLILIENIYSISTDYLLNRKDFLNPKCDKNAVNRFKPQVKALNDNIPPPTILTVRAPTSLKIKTDAKKNTYLLINNPHPDIEQIRLLIAPVSKDISLASTSSMRITFNIQNSDKNEVAKKAAEYSKLLREKEGLEILLPVNNPLSYSKTEEKEDNFTTDLLKKLYGDIYIRPLVKKFSKPALKNIDDVRNKAYTTLLEYYKDKGICIPNIEILSKTIDSIRVSINKKKSKTCLVENPDLSVSFKDELDKLTLAFPKPAILVPTVIPTSIPLETKDVHPPKALVPINFPKKPDETPQQGGEESLEKSTFWTRNNLSVGAVSISSLLLAGLWVLLTSQNIGALSFLSPFFTLTLAANIAIGLGIGLVFWIALTGLVYFNDSGAKKAEPEKVEENNKLSGNNLSNQQRIDVVPKTEAEKPHVKSKQEEILEQKSEEESKEKSKGLGL